MKVKVGLFLPHSAILPLRFSQPKHLPLCSISNIYNLEDQIIGLWLFFFSTCSVWYLLYVGGSWCLLRRHLKNQTILSRSCCSHCASVSGDIRRELGGTVDKPRARTAFFPLSTLSCQVTFPGSWSHIFCLLQRFLPVLFVDSVGPTVNMFSLSVSSECEAIGAVAGDENLAYTFDISSEKT